MEPVWLIQVFTIRKEWRVDITARPHYTHQAAYGHLRQLRRWYPNTRKQRVRKYICEDPKP